MDEINTSIKIGLLVAIAVVFPLMVGFGIEAFYPSPEQPYQKCQSVAPKSKSGEEMQFFPEQDPNFKKCVDEQKPVFNTYNRNLFIITTIIGFAAIAGGALYLSEVMGPVAPGLVFGGLLTILYGAMRSFEAVDKRWLFLELVLVLIGLVLITRRYLKVVTKPGK